MTSDPLPGGWWETAERIAGWAASRNRGATPWLSLADRRDAALDAIVEEISAGGWPAGTLHPLFRAASRGIQHRERETRKHLVHGEAWMPARGGGDELAEHVTDRIAVWQVTWALSDGQWLVIWATAEVMKRDGTQADAAALAGLPVAVFKQRLHRARRQCQALWVSPGEHPPARQYSSIRPDGTPTKAAKARNRRSREAA